jgi:hypothetical protein
VSNKSDLIFEKWKADLAKKDRSHKNVESNFDELFASLHKSKVSFDDAYSLLSKAIQAHYPSRDAIKYTFRNLRSMMQGKTETEFEKTWKDNIDAAGKRVFYSLYPIDGQEKEEAQFGSMSAVEYRKQRQYADSFPRVDWENITWELQTTEDLLHGMDDINGAKDE